MALHSQRERDAFFDRLYEEQFLKMWRYALVMVKDRALAEEVVQDAFVEVLHHLDGLMDSEKPERWLQRTVKNKGLHAMRTQARDLRRLVSLDGENAPEPAAPDLLARVEEDETESLARTREKIAAALTEEERRLLERVALDRVSYKALAEETGCSVAACQKRVQRLRKKLRDFLEKSP